MILERRRRSSEFNTVRFKESNNCLIREREQNNKLWRNRFMLSFGNSICKRKKKEKGLKLRRKRNLSRILCQSLIGKRILDSWLKSRRRISLVLKNKCLLNNGKEKRNLKENWRDKSSYWTEKETLNWLDTMRLRRNLEKSSWELKRTETRTCSTMRSLENKN
mgnify:CR=1 FL=1